jgi:hypothetical protein
MIPDRLKDIDELIGTKEFLKNYCATATHL